MLQWPTLGEIQVGMRNVPNKLEREHVELHRYKQNVLTLYVTRRDNCYRLWGRRNCTSYCRTSQQQFVSHPANQQGSSLWEKSA